MGNPFLDDCPELLVLNTRNCVSDEVIETVKNIKDLGLSQYKEYVDGVIVSRDIQFTNRSRRIPYLCLKGKH